MAKYLGIILVLLSATCVADLTNGMNINRLMGNGCVRGL